jgi:hypothetical protein
LASLLVTKNAKNAAQQPVRLRADDGRAVTLFGNTGGTGSVK